MLVIVTVTLNKDIIAASLAIIQRSPALYIAIRSMRMLGNYGVVYP